MKPKVLVATTSRWYPTARLVMALHRAGCEVDAVCPKLHPLRKTRAVGQVHTYFGLSPLRSFAGAIRASQPEFIISGDDLATRHLQRLHAREKAAGSKICGLIERSFGAPESFTVVSARAAFLNLAQQEGLRVPSTQAVGDLGELKQWVGRMGLPAVLKADGTSGGDGVRIAHTLEEAERAFTRLHAPPLLARAVKRALLDQDKTLLWPSLMRRRAVVNVQPFVAGCEATSALFCWQGKVLASLHFEVINKASAAGHATVLRAIEHAEMSAAADAIARRLRLSGVYGLDFMLEAETGNAYLIEINPRATQVGHLNLGPGRDIPAALYSALCGHEAGDPLIQFAEKQSAQKITEKVTESVREKEIIALFPQEWIRDPESPFLGSAYHDVPWEEPELVEDCVRNRQKQSAWYARGARKPAMAHTPAASSKSRTAIAAPGKSPRVEFGSK